MNQVLDDIDRAIKDIAAGRPVVVVDDANRENEGDIIIAAALATPELLAFMVSPAAKWMTGTSVRMDGGEIKGI